MKTLIIDQLRSDTTDAPGIDVRTADFHTLSSAQVERIVDAAKRYRYRKPANANGSTARYFFAMLQRHANKNRSHRHEI